MSSPDEDTLLASLRTFRAQNPFLARAKVLEKLRQEKGWIISEKRLKTLMDAHNLNTPDVENQRTAAKQDALPVLPPNPLEAQIEYNEKSTRIFKLYCKGEYDFGVSPNADMQVFINICIEKIIQFLKSAEVYNNSKALSHEAVARLAASSPVQSLWDFYQAAAKIAGISKEHVARQFEAEYKVDPRLGEDADPVRSAALKQEKASEYRVGKIGLLKQIAKQNPQYVDLDEHGEPIYQEWKHGQYAIVIMKIDKDGKECGRCE